MPDTPSPTATKTTPSRGTENLNLPLPRHAKRVPAHISKDQLARIRHAAYVLPQVVKPADYIAENSAGFEEHLDTLGLVLLQKPVSGSRPSASQARRTRSRSVTKSASAPKGRFHSSAKAAARRGVRDRPAPPMMIGGPGRCVGLGRAGESVRV